MAMVCALAEGANTIVIPAKAGTHLFFKCRSNKVKVGPGSSPG
jgi:hypothetical protein